MTGANATRDPDSVLASWLDEGPTDLPDVTRRAILTALPTTPQARRGPFAAWRRWTMTPLARAAAAILVAAVALGGIYLVGGRATPSAGGPTPSAGPSATPIDTATWQHVTSRRFGISYEIPPDWAVHFSNDPWTYGGGGPGVVGFDGSTPPGQDFAMFTVASQQIPPGVDQSTWFATYFRTPFGGGCMGPSDVSGFTPTTLAGAPAFEWDGLGPGSPKCGRAVVIAFDGGRAYRLEYDPVQAIGVDRGLMAAWLRTVILTPGNAVDAPAGASIGPPPS